MVQRDSLTASTRSNAVGSNADGLRAAFASANGQLSRKRFVAVVLLFLVAYPFWASQFWINLANLVALASLGAIALNLLVGVAGQFSMGSAALLGVGGFTAAIFAVEEATLPFPLVLALGALLGGLIAVAVGIVALRVRGIYLVLATIALHYIVLTLVKQYQDATAGPAGFRIPLPTIAGAEIVSLEAWYWLLMGIAVVTALGAANLFTSRTGRAWTAVKNRDIAASILGVNVTRITILAFVVSSAVIAVQGVLLAYYVGIVSSEAYTLDVTIQYVAMIIIGGLGSVTGSVLGAIFVTVMPFLVRDFLPLLPTWVPGREALIEHSFAVQSIIFGLSIVLFMRVAPKGLVALLRRLASRVTFVLSAARHRALEHRGRGAS